jgi:hypothetical protein
MYDGFQIIRVESVMNSSWISHRKGKPMPGRKGKRVPRREV